MAPKGRFLGAKLSERQGPDMPIPIVTATSYRDSGSGRRKEVSHA